MITITKDFDFSAQDFFDYLDQQLIQAIKKARNNDLPVNLTSGTRYKQGDINTEITKYKRGEIYEAHFENKRLNILISYHTTDTKNGVRITFSENIKSYDPAAHSKLNNWFYNWQLKMGARKELNRMASNIRAYKIA